MTYKEVRELVDWTKVNINEGNAPLHLLRMPRSIECPHQRFAFGEMIINIARRELDEARA